MTQVGDRVTYRNREAIVVTVHPNGSANLVYGTPYSDESEGLWPVANAANVPSNQFEPVGDESPTGDDEDDDADSGGGDEDDSGEDDVDTDGDVVIKADDFVDRTPVTDVAEDIRSGDYDGFLDEIEAAEADNRDRDTVYDAIESRR